MSDLKPILPRISTGETLSENDAALAFDIIMSGQATPSQIGALLMGMRMRGETVAEITGAARTMRAKALMVKASANAVDIVGTGGDCSGTYNISTGAALVIAACGVTVAKHGNKAQTSKSGSADVLKALGVNLDAELPVVERSIAEARIGFMLATRHHSAMKHVGPTRVEIGTRTIFNILGPLANPANVKRLVIGVFSKDWLEPLAQVLGNLGAERAWLVHGSDGLDEITTTGPTDVAELKDGKVTTFSIAPEDVGLVRVAPEALKGGDPDFNAAALRAILEPDVPVGLIPLRDAVAFNAAAALVVSNAAKSLQDGVRMALKVMKDGSAKDVLANFIRITNED
ncbi:MAG: anthranilate phosphoribosyltransferase [Rhodospirillaceae bacterium]|nr:anthranilate phosphoribosyltransferase [Rhodospirillaceae bacterium]